MEIIHSSVQVQSFLFRLDFDYPMQYEYALEVPLLLKILCELFQFCEMISLRYLTVKGDKSSSTEVL
jgi:hypothetical protein